MILKYSEIINKLSQLDLSNYSKNRNFIDGDVTMLSPYISRGMLSTKIVLNSILSRNINIAKIEKFIQELAWRDYWQTFWKNKDINPDIRHAQKNVINYGVPKAIINAKTGIDAIDKAIVKLYKDGYVHNHLRMYIASIICNTAKCHWKIPAKWFYYHLRDGDWGSNALSWQWVCGTNSAKKYYANQKNINLFCYTKQQNTFLDKDYSDLSKDTVPEILINSEVPNLNFLSLKTTLCVDNNKPSLIYNYYNIDPLWRKDIDANKILLIEPSVFEKYPVSKKNIDFLISLSKNISGIQIFYGEFDELKKKLDPSEIYYKEHPLNYNYSGNCDERDWMFSSQKFYPSFFKFWNNYKTEIGF